MSAVYTHFSDRQWFVRGLEILPGLVSWSFILGPVVLSVFYPVVVAYFIVAFDLYWLGKALRMIVFLVRGYVILQRSRAMDWSERVSWLYDPAPALIKAERRLNDMVRQYPRAARPLHFTASSIIQRQRYKSLVRDIDTLRDIQARPAVIMDPRDIYHLVIIATYNEDREITESTVKGVLEAGYNLDRMMLVIAYEGRGGQAVETSSRDLIELYGKGMAYAEAIKHPDGITGELKAKGANISYAARRATEVIEKQGIPAEQVIITTLDADNKPDVQYFNNLSYTFALDPNRQHKSYQPVPMFFNNIWDAPAPMRVIATGNTFFQLMEMMRPHRLRNFTSHAQPLKALIETDFWSVTSPVEDGHQFWRSYFTFNGDYAVVPLYIPIYQDAVLASTYAKTIVAQYKQLNRWAYGVSDFPYVVRHCLQNKQISLGNKVVHTWRLFEGHVSWATATLIVTFVAWLPLFLNQRFSHQELAHQLPIIASRVQTIAMLGLFVMISISIISLPPRPKRYGRHRNIFMVLQWVLLPVTGLIFHSLAAIDAQTRLMLGRPFGFYVTAKNRRS